MPPRCPKNGRSFTVTTRQDTVAVHDELAQALQAVKHALCRAAADCDARRRDFQHILFGSQCTVCRQTDGTFGGTLHAASEHRFDDSGKQFGNAPQLGVPTRADHGRGGYGEGSFAGDDRHGPGYDVRLGAGSESRADSEKAHSRKNSFFMFIRFLKVRVSVVEVMPQPPDQIA